MGWSAFSSSLASSMCVRVDVSSTIVLLAVVMVITAFVMLRLTLESTAT